MRVNIRKGIFLMSFHTSASKALLQSTPKTNSKAMNTLSKESIVKTSETLSKDLLQYANSYSATYGLLLQQTTSTSFQPAPISLLPNIIPSKSFSKGKEISTEINTLMDRISRDHDFLSASLQGVDEAFTGKLLDMFHDIYSHTAGDDVGKQAAKNADSLGILRSDYMLTTTSDDEGTADYALKQIECNTIASSFSGLAVQVSKFHSFLCSRFGVDGKGVVSNFLKYNRDAIMGNNDDSSSSIGYIPDNHAVENVAKSMNVAHERYVSRNNIPNEQKVAILFIVQEDETNTIDQRILEYTLWNNHQIPVLRLSLLEAYDQLTVRESDAALVLEQDGDTTTEISIVYFRAGYTPTDFPTSAHWKARAFLEVNKATKCPNLPFHLAGTKKVQQLISKPEVLQRFIDTTSNNKLLDDILSVFANLYTLNEEDATDRDKDAILDAMSKEGCHKYVLKPQREGGGNNYYNQEMVQLLQSHTTSSSSSKIILSPKLKEYILMERLFPPQQLSILLRSGEVMECNESISELGMFGMIVSDSEGAIVFNEYGGYLLRTKFSNVDEGGVASGFATLSTPLLCD